MSDILEVASERLRDEPPRTHWRGCETAHDVCLIAKLAAELTELRSVVKRLERYDQMLTEAMPEDYKDWHQNSREEWPLIASLTIKNLRNQNDWAHEELTKAHAEIERLRDTLMGRALAALETET